MKNIVCEKNYGSNFSDSDSVYNMMSVSTISNIFESKYSAWWTSFSKRIIRFAMKINSEAAKN